MTTHEGHINLIVKDRRTGVVTRHSRFSLYQLMISECQDGTQSRSQPEYP